MNLSLSLTPEVLESLFTMTFTFDRELRILRASQRLQQRCPLVQAGKSATEVFNFHRPRGISSFQEIEENKDTLYLLISHDHTFALRGQVISTIDHPDALRIFVGAPWMSWMLENRPEVPLELADFPKHDAQMDQSFYVMTQKSSLLDLENLNSELLKARDEARKAEKAQAAFFAVMSHEMRTPLNGVINAIELMAETTDPTEREKLMTITRSSAGNLLSLVNYALDYAKLEANRMELEEVVFDLQEVIGSVTDILDSRARAKQIELQCEFSADCPRWLLGDSDKLRQVLINLTSNSVKFTEQGCVKLRVGYDRLDEQSATLNFEVEDSGIGISKEDQAYIFDAFWSSKNRTLSGDENTGLGLNICSQLVKLMKGEISVTSEPGKGSCFTVKLPFSLADSVQVEAIPETNKDVDLATRFEGHVLLVDDNQTNLIVGEMVLENLGLQVRLASDGEEAVEIASERDFDVILMDISMPRMDGTDATRSLRSLGCQTPIIAVTAHIGKKQAEEFLSAGMQGVLHKPLDKAAMIGMLSRWLPKRQGDTDSYRGADTTIDSAQPDTGPLDLDRINRITRKLNEEQSSRFFKVFDSEASSLVSNIHDAWLRRDLDKLSRDAHSLKGSALNFGATELAELVKQIEAASREHNLDRLSGLLPQIDPVYGTTRAELQRCFRVATS